MNKPVVFKFLDALYFAFPGVALIILGVYLAVKNTEGALLTGVVGLCFFGIWVSVLWSRKKLIDSYPIVTKYNVLIKHNGYHITRLEAEDAIKKLLALYQLHWLDAKEALTSEYTWVEFVPGTIEIKGIGKPMLVAGFVRAGGRTVKVGFFDSKTKKPDSTVPLERTAFAHELGHIILGSVLNNWNESLHHSTTKEKGLP